MNEQRSREVTKQSPSRYGSTWSRRQLLGFAGRSGAAASLMGAGIWGHWGELRLPELLESAKNGITKWPALSRYIQFKAFT